MPLFGAIDLRIGRRVDYDIRLVLVERCCDMLTIGDIEFFPG